MFMIWFVLCNTPTYRLSLYYSINLWH